MANYVSYSPSSAISSALFNFDAFGIENFRLAGAVRVSVSDSFTASQYLSVFPLLSSDIYTALTSGSGGWTAEQLANINLVTSTYANFVNLSFLPVANYSGFTPANVGSVADINISFIYRADLAFSGQSALGTDASFGYLESRGDVVLNVNRFGSSGLGNDYSLNSSSFGFHVLMHEIGHSLGLSHPHTSIEHGVPAVSADYAAITGVGFDKLGFRIRGPQDMNKEYFSVMSYDDQMPAGEADTFAQTPMILDVIALQSAYGEGPGSSGSGNDVVTAGGGGGVNAYRTYFDGGGLDTINLVNYAFGAYLHMGTTIVGATHLVGVAMSVADANTMINLGGDPSSLRWFYGEFENAIGSSGNDLIVGSAAANVIDGGVGQDRMFGGAGDDTYLIDSTADVVGEDPLSGVDQVVSSVDYTTGANVENLTLTGSGSIKGTGNDLQNTLEGNAAANVLTGFAGADILSGMAGSDVLTGGSGALSFNANGARARLVDLDGDGKVDIAQTEASGRIRGWLSSGTGFGNQTIWGTGSRPQDQMADLSGDRRADVVQLHENGNIYVWTSTGTGFNAYDVWGRGSRPTDTLADFNGDGRADLVQLHENGNLYVWTSTGTGFNDYDVWGRGSRPADQIADFNGDGRADVVQLHENGNMYVWKSNGNGFNAYDVWGRGSRPTDKLADFNGDGKADVVQLHENGNIYVWTSNGSGFNAYDVWGRGSRPTDQLADVNGDGKADVVQLHENGNIYVWTSNGRGFNDYTVWGRGSRPTDQLADVNGDGRADVVQLHENGNAYVWLSTGTSFADYRVLATGAPDGGGNDTFVFGPGFGRDTIRDFDGGLGAGDVIKFDRAVFGSFAAVMSKTADDGLGNTLITYDSANTLLLEHVRKAQLAADDFLFG